MTDLPEFAFTFSVAQAQQHGLLNGVHDHRVYLTINDRLVRFRTNIYTSAIDIAIEYPGRAQDYSIEYTTVSLSFGCRYYFLCPFTKTRCTEVGLTKFGFARRGMNRRRDSYPKDTPDERLWREFAAMRARLLGEDGRGPARGAVKARLIEQLRADPRIEEQWPELGNVLDAVEGRQRKLAAKSFRASAMRGWLTHLAGYHMQEEVDRQRASLHQAKLDTLARDHSCDGVPASLLSGSKRRPIGMLADHPMLDIDRLAERFAETKADSVAVGLRWRLPDRSVVAATVAVRLSGMPFAHVHLYDPPDSQPIGQRLTVVRRSPGRWAFQCPVTGRQAQHLYLRGGLFASATAQRLIHASQRKAPR